MDEPTLHSDEPHTLAALLALGLLDDDETTAFEALLPEHAALAQEVRTFEQVVQVLGFAAPAVTPPDEVRTRLLTAIQTLPQEVGPVQPSYDASQPFVLHADEGAWAEGPVPGMQIKTLFLDMARRYTTQLIRLRPGTHVPPHWHADAEECYLVEGSFHVDTQDFHVGDYIRMPAGSLHNVIRSETGCVLLVTASLDEMPQS